eukprot:Skav215988  [mRNA]  locus=scaffold4693:4641:6848:- [translate_table: standard]
MADPHELSLEPQFSHIDANTKVNLLAEVVYYNPGRHVCRSAIFRQLFETSIDIPVGTTSFTVLTGTIQPKAKWFELTMTEEAHLLLHSQLTRDNMLQVVEACAGIGAMGVGFEAAGSKTIAYVENNQKFCQWLEENRSAPVINADVGSAEAIAKVHQIAGGSPSLAAGVSCQPFSRAGDRREQFDERSSTFGDTLKMGLFLRSPLILMECTQEVMESQWAQQTLKQFTDQTGYRLTQQTLALHTMWPSFRTRWWAVLSHPAFGITDIPKLPTLPFVPGLFQLMPCVPTYPDDELQQLLLDTYELSMFDAQPGGMGRYVPDFMKPAPTATHSWGTQLSPCHCGCRSSGFSYERLTNKGLYGVLLPVGYCIRNGSNVLHQMRFPHPKEVSLWNGLRPDYLSDGTTSTKKLELAGVGQLASPLQSAWVLAHAYQQASNHGFWVNDVTPNDAVYQVISDVWQARATTMNVPTTMYTEIFEHQIRLLLGQEVTTVASGASDPVIHHEHPSDQPPTHATSGEEGFTQLFQAECDRVDPPNERASVSRSRSPQARHHSSLQTSSRDHPETEEAPERPHPFMQELQSVMIRPDAPMQEPLADQASDPITYEANGGISAFASGPATASHQATPVADPTHGEAPAPVEIIEETQSELGENPVASNHDHPSFAHHHPSIVEDTSPRTEGSNDISPTLPWTEATQVQVWVGHKGEALAQVTVKADSTVGAVAFAEEKIGGKEILSSH